MRFRTRQQPRGVIPRKHQVRLTLMLMGLAAVLIGSRLFGKPEFWARMFPDEAVASVENSAVNVVSRTVFRPELTSEPVAIPLAAELQDVIRDDVMGVRAEEWKAWAFSLRLAEDLVEQSRAGEVLRLPSAKYALLMDAPENCRGRAWQITGTLRRMTRERVMNRNLGEMTVIDAWLTLPDSGDGLVHVVSRFADDDIPLQQDFGKNAPEVSLMGYFFKREAYASASEDGASIAPLILAGGISKVKLPEVVHTRSDQLTPWLGWLAVVTCTGLGLVIWSFLASDAVHRGQRTHELTRLPPSPSFEGVDAESPHEMLQHLEATAEPSGFELPHNVF